MPGVPYLESHLLFVVIIYAFRALQLKRRSSPLETWRFISMERVRCSFRPRVRAAAQNHVFLGGTRRRWIVLDSRDTCRTIGSVNKPFLRFIVDKRRRRRGGDYSIEENG